MAPPLRYPFLSLLGPLHWVPAHTVHQEESRQFLQYLNNDSHTHLLLEVGASNPEKEVTPEFLVGLEF